MRSGSAHGKHDGEPSWSYEREEVDAKIRLIDAKAERTEAEARRLDAERVDIKFGIVRKATYLVIVVAIALVVLAQLLLEPGRPVFGGGVSVLGLLIWLANRAGAA